MTWKGINFGLSIGEFHSISGQNDNAFHEHRCVLAETMYTCRSRKHMPTVVIG